MEVPGIDCFRDSQESGRRYVLANGVASLEFASRRVKERIAMTNVLLKLGLLAGCLVFAWAVEDEGRHAPAQVIALDECDPATFNAPTAAGPDFCKNVAVGASTTFADLFSEAAKGSPNPNWDFEPDSMTIKEGTTISAVDQGGEPHTFTEVKQFGGGFIPGLNGGEATVPECNGGFSNIAVARTRILQGSTLQFGGLAKGEHLFQCCIHPWMRTTVHVK